MAEAEKIHVHWDIEKESFEFGAHNAYNTAVTWASRELRSLSRLAWS